MENTYTSTCHAAVMHGPLPSLFCCIGDPVIGNPTQIMMEAAFQSLGYPAYYLTCTVAKDQLGAAIKGIKALGFRGANITAPYKVDVLPFLDGCTDSARLTQAVNCISIENGTLLGDNTDGKGFLASIEQLTPVEGMRVLVFGAGGAARSIVTELALHGASSILIANRTEQKAQKIVEYLQPHVPCRLESIALQRGFSITQDYDLVVQATSVGLFSPQDTLDIVWEVQGTHRCIAADVVFNPVHTRFLDEAQNAGAITVDGLGMLVCQGAIAVSQWTGRQSEHAVMRSALTKAFLL